MLPPALGGLRISHAAGPGPPCAREYGKDQVVMRSPAGHWNYTTFALSPSNRKNKKSSACNEITARTKSRRICRGEAGTSERRPYQGGATDLHPALSSPSATLLRSRGYAARLSEPTERRRAQRLRRKTRLMEGEARDEGASAELSDMRRRGSLDAR